MTNFRPRKRKESQALTTTTNLPGSSGQARLPLSPHMEVGVRTEKETKCNPHPQGDYNLTPKLRQDSMYPNIINSKPSSCPKGKINFN